MNTEFYQKLIQIIPEEAIKLEEPMKDHTTFQVGGPAEYYIEVELERSLIELLPLIQEYGMDYFILGNGSNLLVSDQGYRGVIICLKSSAVQMKVTETTITVWAGTLLSTVANEATRNQLTGMEFAAGIPGTIGGAVVMNAGAYDGEMKDIVSSVRILNKQGKIITLTVGELAFGYRTSILKLMPVVVLEVTLTLEAGNRDDIITKMKEFTEMRKAKQPLMLPNAGSTFKRPTGYYAGKLIMEAGLSGYRMGGACVSPIHCGFLVNDRQATASDLYGLMQHVIATVQECHAITLEPEVVCLGTFQ